MRWPQAYFEAVKVADKVAAKEGFKDLEDYKSSTFHWRPTDHLPIIAYHRLVGDGWTTEHLFVEAGLGPLETLLRA
ncbi:uncharacterized protein P174DRAFT_424681 [Aspergillus novofumigatus IBT 16806]|uniref:Uncharacterized protein n=1 Tax=Aspergillus novofumigatus (strain IBT 16806) TaxID=1392255 RepID=A0A2I1BYR8_ASPN1|nr:uncharacterized protein P174DRAFT_424681 [Aspergillus novofumigatus IBT 16806]PKX90515.1 hypothetical protein P174DRAFT_424681 [Aspergillus novofumigatus IBT 16806]